jgi:hypothetical protein
MSEFVAGATQLLHLLHSLAYWKTMSKISLLVSLDETVSPVAVAGVEDLEYSWVITGITIVVNGMTMTSRQRLARKRVSVSDPGPPSQPLDRPGGLVSF